MDQIYFIPIVSIEGGGGSGAKAQAYLNGVEFQN